MPRKKAPPLTRVRATRAIRHLPFQQRQLMLYLAETLGGGPLCVGRILTTHRDLYVAGYIAIEPVDWSPGTYAIALTRAGWNLLQGGSQGLKRPGGSR